MPTKPKKPQSEVPASIAAAPKAQAKAKPAKVSQEKKAEAAPKPVKPAAEKAAKPASKKAPAAPKAANAAKSPAKPKAPKAQPAPKEAKVEPVALIIEEPVAAPLAVAPVEPVMKESVVSNPSPVFSAVIPVYNEAQILAQAVEQLVANLTPFGLPFEIILAENGSKDDTIAIGESLAQKYPFVSIFHHPEPDYGLAMRAGILRARGEFVVCDEIDLCDPRFYESALSLLRSHGAEMVVGSKALASSQDERPLMRRVATKVLNGMLRVGTGFKGTDTHGLKAFARERLLPVLHECKLGKDLFASEFVIRAERAGHRIVEVPLQLRELRAPSVHLFKRVPKVMKDMARLVYLIRVKG